MIFVVSTPQHKTAACITNILKPFVTHKQKLIHKADTPDPAAKPTWLMTVSETETVAGAYDGFNILFGFHIVSASAELSGIPSE